MPTTPAEMILKIETALYANPSGVVTIDVDGQRTEYDRAQALTELEYWRQRDAGDKGARPRSARINLSGF